jgi:hypothetical protein
MSKKAKPTVYAPSVGNVSKSLLQKLKARPATGQSNARGNIDNFPSDSELESALQEVFLEKEGHCLGLHLIVAASYKIQGRYSRKAIPIYAIQDEVIRSLGRMVRDGRVLMRFEPFQASFELNYDREMVLDLPSLDQ